MEKKLLLAGVVITGLFTSVNTYANNSPTCIPSVVKEGNKYQISHSGRIDRVKVMKIEKDSCWVKVKAMGSGRVSDPAMVGTADTKPFWINFNNVSSVR